MIVRVRNVPGGFDEYGDPIEGTQDSIILDGAFTAPRESPEIDGRGRNGVIVGLTLFAPYGADLRYTDQVEVDGELYDIEGEPGRWRNPLTSWEAGTQVALTRAQG